jgi:hypothetical protein
VVVVLVVVDVVVVGDGGTTDTRTATDIDALAPPSAVAVM